MCGGVLSQVLAGPKSWAGARAIWRVACGAVWLPGTEPATCISQNAQGPNNPILGPLSNLGPCVWDCTALLPASVPGEERSPRTGKEGVGSLPNHQQRAPCICPTYRFLLFLFLEASSSSPLICREKIDMCSEREGLEPDHKRHRGHTAPAASQVLRESTLERTSEGGRPTTGNQPPASGDLLKTHLGPWPVGQKPCGTALSCIGSGSSRQDVWTVTVPLPLFLNF